MITTYKVATRSDAQARSSHRRCRRPAPHSLKAKDPDSRYSTRKSLTLAFIMFKKRTKTNIPSTSLFLDRILNINVRNGNCLSFLGRADLGVEGAGGGDVSGRWSHTSTKQWVELSNEVLYN